MILLAAAMAMALKPESPRPERIGQPMLDGKPLPFSEAVRVGDTLYLSGQIGRTQDGKLPAGIDAQARQTMDNIAATLAKAGAGWRDVVKCTVMLDDMKDWPAFNAVYASYFKNGQFPARSAFGADGLALGARVEVECLAVVAKRP